MPNPLDPRVFNNVSFGGQSPNQSMVFDRSGYSGPYSDVDNSGADPNQMAGTVPSDVTQWMQKVTAPQMSQGPVEGDPAGPLSSGSFGQSPISSIVSGQGQGGYQNPMNPYLVAGGALSSLATGLRQDQILGANVKDMASQVDLNRDKQEQNLLNESAKVASITGQGGWQKLPNGQTIAGLTSPAQKQIAGEGLLPQLIARSKPGGIVSSKDILPYADAGLGTKMARYGGAGLGVLGGITGIMKDQGKGGISWGKIGSALHLPGSQPDWNQYNQQGGWTYDEQGNKIPVPASWYQPQPQAPADNSYDDGGGDSGGGDEGF